MNVQRLFYFLAGLSLVLSSSTAFAVEAKDKALLSQFEQIKKNLQSTAKTSVACETPQAKDCTFQSYCDKFDGKYRDFYLYQNEEGRQVPNFQMISYASATDACLGKLYQMPLHDDPFVYPKQLTDVGYAGTPDKLHTSYMRYEAEQTRAQKIFNEVQGRVVNLLNSRRTSANAEATDEMIARVKTIQFNFPKGNQELSDLAKDGCEIPNAFYNAWNHQVTVCPQILNLPDAALFSVISHEVGHAIDPCQATIRYTKSSRGISAESLYSSTVGQSYIFQAINAEANPFKEVISCLQLEKSIHVAIPTVEQSMDNAERRLVKQTGTSGNRASLAATITDQRSSVRKLYGSHSSCNDVTGNGHMQEAFSDWIASQTLKQKVSEIQETAKSQQYAFESQSLYLGVACQNINQTSVAYLRPLVGEKCPNLLSAMESADLPDDGGKSHPATAARVNRIMFATPEMQKALGCKKDDSVAECQ